MAHRALLLLHNYSGSASAFPSWVRFAAGRGATWWSADGARRAFARAQEGDEPVPLQTEGLPPPWEPPPHNPRSLKPKPVPMLAEILTQIQQARNAVNIHNAYRRKSSCLPPIVAAAMFTRLSQLLSETAAPPSRGPDNASSGAAAAAAAGRATHEMRGQTVLVAEIRKSWDVFLHLTSARNLAALVRASCETGLLLRPDDGAAAGSRARSATLRGGGGLVQRSLDVLLDSNGRELAEAGPHAVVDVSYGMMLAGYKDTSAWRTLAPMLSAAATQLAGKAVQGSAGDEAGGNVTGAANPGGLAEKVLKWLAQEKRLQV